MIREIPAKKIRAAALAIVNTTRRRYSFDPVKWSKLASHEQELAMAQALAALRAAQEVR